VQVQKALFSVTRRNANVFLVLQVFKTLQGDVEVCRDAYAKISVSSLAYVSYYTPPDSHGLL
jgi:hypothetical protein